MLYIFPVRISNENFPTAVMKKRHFLSLSFISLCPNAPYPVDGRSVYSLSLRSGVRRPPLSKGLETLADLMKN